MVCPKCGKNIRYIAIRSDKVVCCEEQELEFYTINGTHKLGYLPHHCEVDKDGNKENTRRN